MIYSPAQREKKVQFILDFILARVKAHPFSRPPGELEVREALGLKFHDSTLLDDAFELYYDSILEAAEDRMKDTEVNTNEAFVQLCVTQLTNHLEMSGIDPSKLQVTDMQVNYEPKQPVETVRVMINLKEE